MSRAVWTGSPMARDLRKVEIASDERPWRASKQAKS